MKITMGESQKREDAGARKGRKVAKHYVFPMICGSGGSKSRLAKAAGAETSGQMGSEQLHAMVVRTTIEGRKRQTDGTGAVLEVAPLWREAHFEVKSGKTPGVRTAFGS